MSPETVRLLRRLARHKGVLVGTAIVLVWVGLALLGSGPLTGFELASFDPAEGLARRRLPPLGAGPDGRTFLCGTDDLGRDVLGLVLHGARYSLTIGLCAVAVSLLLGVPIGLVAGYFGGRLDGLLMRGLDVLMAFPTILLAICVVTALGQSLPNLMLAVGIVGVPAVARQLRAQVLVVRELEYVQAARALGFSHTRILALHVLPNCLAPVIVLGTLGTATAILETAGLGFIGLGAEPGTPEWGLLISDNKNLVTAAPWTVLTPGAAIVLLVLGLNLLGDGLRDVLDPRLAGRTG